MEYLVEHQADYQTIFDSSMNKAYKVKERRMKISKILAAILMSNEEKKENE